MDFLIALVLVAVVAAVLGGKGKRKPRRRPRSTTTAKHTPAKRMAARETAPDPYLYLYEHWKRVESEPDSFPRWYGDPVTDAQLKRLSSDGIALPARPITKGQASDLIGLATPPDDQALEILNYFKVKGLPLKHESIARIEADRILSDPEKSDAFKNRPATPIQIEFYRWLGEKPPRGLTATAALEFASSVELTDEQDDEWSQYLAVFDDFQDKDFLADYNLKKPSIPLIAKAISLKKNSYEDITAMMADDLIDTLLELKPDLERK